MDSVIFIVLRRMRAPLILLIGIYTVSILGLVLVPGVDANGQTTAPMSFFHAFYFISYTASTIGFGELPQTFSDAQRMWATVCIYLSVIGWSYSILTLLALVQDKGFQNAFARIRFVRQVAGLGEPFHLICGFGEAGAAVGRALDRNGQRFVVVELSEARVQEIDLMAFHADVPALAADARVPQNLLQAGLQHRRCLGVLALTDDEQANLAVAMSVRLLAPRIPVFARVHSPAVAANMASFGTDHILNPFDLFAQRLAVAIRTPTVFRLLQWLGSLPGQPLPEAHTPPGGAWVICGYGRFGQAVMKAIGPLVGPITVIEKREVEIPGVRCIQGAGTEAEPLAAAGVRDAAGIVAATDDDVNNLSIAVTARELNPRLFVVMRQNLNASAPLFEAFLGDFALEAPQLVASASLLRLGSPLLARFLDEAMARDDAWAAGIITALAQQCGERTPEIWSARLNLTQARAVHRHLMREQPVTLADLLRDPGARDARLAALPLVVERDGQRQFMPPLDLRLEAGDEILFAGRHRARQRQRLLLLDANVLDYVLTGRESPGGSFWRWRARRHTA